MVEYHPLKPFLPANAKVLFLGSFPPPKKRWCMDFFYPNFINDHWRIEGQIWFDDKNHFVDAERKCFKMNEIIAFLNEKGIAFYDTATAVKRLKDNASDAFLEIVEHTDIEALLKQMPQCHVIATTGEKATQEVCTYYKADTIPSLNEQITLREGLTLYRLPSSSRAYPLSFDKKVEAYRRMFEAVFGGTNL
ncbi:MAG: uracil-DNA glycosylase family protein [Bacteroidales bacterium]|nr:uracil-DNA glycosylase family protein [Bacteroidales bacterium]